MHYVAIMIEISSRTVLAATDRSIPRSLQHRYLSPDEWLVPCLAFTCTTSPSNSSEAHAP